jgi:hypothetical protein
MLTIRRSQFDALGIAMVRRFEDLLLGKMETVFPRESERLGDDGMRAVVRLGMERAQGHVFSADEDVFAFVALMFMLGSYFDEDPQLPWAAEALNAAGSSEGRAQALYARAMRHLDEVAGEKNERLIRALLRLRDMPLGLLDDVAPDALQDAIVSVLASAYPEKIAVQGDAATRTVVAGAVALATDQGMAMNRGSLLFAALAAMCGAGFARDPQVPWVAEILASDAAADIKLTQLYEEAQDFVAFGLS